MSDHVYEFGEIEHEPETAGAWQAELLYLAADIKPYNPVGAERLRQLAARLTKGFGTLGADVESAASDHTRKIALRLVH